MAHAKVSDEDLICTLIDVFRAQGYEGTSLSQISEATGLEKASLYHRFPGGKEDMAAAVLACVHEWLQDRVFGPLQGPGKPAEKLRRVAQSLRELYADGSKSCVLDTLSLPNGAPAVREGLRSALRAWLQAFTVVAREAGVPAAEARRRAEQALMEIEGSLVLARVLGDRKPFHRVIHRLPELLVGSNGRR